MHRYYGLVVKAPGDTVSLDEALDPYRAYGVSLADLEVRCDCIWPRARAQLDGELEATFGEVRRGLLHDNVAARFRELQALWNMRHRRLQKEKDFGQPEASCPQCFGSGLRVEPFFGAFDYFDAPEGADDWRRIVFAHDVENPQWEVPKEMAAPFRQFRVDVESSQRVPGTLCPRNPCRVSELLELCEQGYIPAPSVVFTPETMLRRQDLESRDEWQLQVWEALIAHRRCEAWTLRFTWVDREDQAERTGSE